MTTMKDYILLQLSGNKRREIPAAAITSTVESNAATTMKTTTTSTLLLSSLLCSQKEMQQKEVLRDRVSWDETMMMTMNNNNDKVDIIIHDDDDQQQQKNSNNNKKTKKMMNKDQEEEEDDEEQKQLLLLVQKYRLREQAALAELAKCRAEMDRNRERYDASSSELCELRRWKEESLNHPLLHFERLEHKREMQQMERRFQDEIAALRAEIFFCSDNDGIIIMEKQSDFFQRKYYSLLVLDDETGLPQVCPHTGEALPKAAKFERERDEALAEVRDLRMRMATMMADDSSSVLLPRVQRKARQFKRKYRFLKNYMRENLYVGDEVVDAAFCDEKEDCYPNKKMKYWWAHDPESDEELKEKAFCSTTTTTSGALATTTADLAGGVPSGFVAREAGDDE